MRIDHGDYQIRHLRKHKCYRKGMWWNSPISTLHLSLTHWDHLDVWAHLNSTLSPGVRCNILVNKVCIHHGKGAEISHWISLHVQKEGPF